MVKIQLHAVWYVKAGTEGSHQAKLKTAKNLLDIGLSIENIANGILTVDGDSFPFSVIGNKATLTIGGDTNSTVIRLMQVSSPTAAEIKEGKTP